MLENFNFLFQYLEKEEITIDKNEFEFQMQSHPDYPTLLSIVDTLSFFNVDNLALRIPFSEIEILPSRFIASLNEKKSPSKLYFIEKKENSYFYHSDKKMVEILKNELEKRWEGIILLVEKTETIQPESSKKNSWILPSLVTILFLIVIFLFSAKIKANLFFVFPIIGLLFSIAILKDLFGAKSKLISQFCNMSASTSCTTIVESNKWKVFKFINFSDLSIVFFIVQFLGLFLFLIIENQIDFFNIQKILLFCSIPIILLSLYFQKFVEKKWCPICLVIIGLLLIEMVYLILTVNFNFHLSLKPIILFCLLFFFVSFVWTILKKLLLKQKELKEFQVKANRFIRNYVVFKNNLIVNKKIELPVNHIILGNCESKTKIALISNPFCGHCKDVHEMIETILERHRDNIQIQIIIKADLEKENEDIKAFYRNLMNLYFEKGELIFKDALKFWFANGDTKKWLNEYQNPYLNSMKIDEIYHAHNNWCINQGFKYTPEIFVKGYEYPIFYDRNDLPFFINELIEDCF